jgi:hypothetical protein
MYGFLTACFSRVHVEEYFTTGKRVSRVEEYGTCHMLCLDIRIYSSLLLLFIWCFVTAVSEIDGLKLQNYTGSLVMFWILDFDIFNFLVVFSRLK